MAVVMYDGINSLAAGIARQFPGAPKIAGYVNGIYAWSQAQWNLFPNADHVSVTVTASANAADVLDVEVGDATPDQAAGWIAMRKAAGLYRPTIYCSRSVIPAVRAGTGGYVLGQDYDIWVADYTGSAHEVIAPGTPAVACAATQYASTANYDVSLVYDAAWPHRKAPAPQVADIGISVTLKGQTVDIGWTAVAGATAYDFDLFHWDGTKVYGTAVYQRTIHDTHLEGFHLPGGGQYAVRVKAAGASLWSAWKVF
ncbi:MAG TPA: hypothetical protein VH478_00235 [Trebonia sp.]|jgi:hypothetical protein|nr:hypothetical protein [Trebonia sp.]